MNAHCMLYCAYCVICFLLLKTKSVRSQSVTTSKGVVNGYDYQNVAVFQGIPYAQPPIGKLRFKAPVAASSWTSPLNVTHYSEWCIQTPQKDHPNAPMSEDCLYLNVFTPSLNRSAKLPVMFWIHGGAFSFGSAAQYPVDGIVGNLVSRGVVLVSINYRLNIFGFYTTAPSYFLGGNMGIMDQILALKWVQTEIGGFGGDPTRVTIFGESAGGASVSLLTLSPLAKGLFSQAIMESGTAFNTWAMNGNLDFLYKGSKKTSLRLNCTTSAAWDSQTFGNLLPCMQNASASALLALAMKLHGAMRKSLTDLGCYALRDFLVNVGPTHTNDHIGFVILLTAPWDCRRTGVVHVRAIHEELQIQIEPLQDYINNLVLLKWGPIVDGYVIPDWPRNLAPLRSNMPILIGNNKDETAVSIIDKLWAKSLRLSGISEPFFEYILAKTFQSPGQFGNHGSFIVLRILFYHYILSGPILSQSDNLGWARLITKMTSDYTFFAGTALEASTWLDNGNSQVYMYSFDYESDVFPYPDNYTASFHSFELFFLFKTMFQHFSGYPNWTMSSTDLKVSNYLGLMWTNFAKNGSPGMGWQPISNAGLDKMSQYLSISGTLQMQPYFQNGGCNLWNFLVPSVIGPIAPTFAPSTFPTPKMTTLMTTSWFNITQPAKSTMSNIMSTQRLTTLPRTTPTKSMSQRTSKGSFVNYVSCWKHHLSKFSSKKEIFLEFFDNTAGGGLLYSGASHCDPFWFVGMDQCDMAIKICVEAIPASSNLGVCSTQWIDLGMVTSNKNNATFTTGRYGGWTNPMTLKFYRSTWKGFQTKIIVQDVDNGARQLIDQSVCQFPGTTNGGSNTGVSGCSHVRPSGYSTLFRVAYRKM